VRCHPIIGGELDALDGHLGLGRVTDEDGNVGSWKHGVVFPGHLIGLDHLRGILRLCHAGPSDQRCGDADGQGQDEHSRDALHSRLLRFMES
jgi:hypothetical protein